LDVLDRCWISLNWKVEGIWFLNLLRSGLGVLWEAEVEACRSLWLRGLYFFLEHCREIERVAWRVLLSRELKYLFRLVRLSFNLFWENFIV
jgi:hypothetical protein